MAATRAYGWRVAGPASHQLAMGGITLGLRVRSERTRLGLRLADLASSAGISLSYLSDVERGRTLPSLEVLYSLAVGLDTTVLVLLQDLYPWDVETPPKNVQPPPDGRAKAR